MKLSDDPQDIRIDFPAHSPLPERLGEGRPAGTILTVCPPEKSDELLSNVVDEKMLEVGLAKGTGV
jgi:hypothetical protein